MSENLEFVFREKMWWISPIIILYENIIISKPCHHISSVPFFLAYVDSFSPPAYIRMPGFHNVGRIDIHIGINICCIDPLPCIIKFIYSEKASKILQNLHQLFVLCTASQIIGGDSQNFVAFSEVKLFPLVFGRIEDTKKTFRN